MTSSHLNIFLMYNQKTSVDRAFLTLLLLMGESVGFMLVKKCLNRILFSLCSLFDVRITPWEVKKYWLCCDTRAPHCCSSSDLSGTVHLCVRACVHFFYSRGAHSSDSSCRLLLQVRGVVPQPKAVSFWTALCAEYLHFASVFHGAMWLLLLSEDEGFLLLYLDL